MTAPLHDRPRLDHLVVMADTLAQGAAWCEATLGVAAAPGGEHPLFGTHNRLLTIESPAFPLAYLEIIAINPEATGDRQTGAAGLKRWFDMDDAALREQVRAHGPRLIHWVARVPDLQEAAARLPPSGVTLHALRLKHPRAAALAEACKAAGLGDTAIEPAPQPAIEAVLATPRGVVTLSSIGQPRP